jgi:hypothetical protein
LESAVTTSPSGAEEECALFKIDTVSNPFVFSGIVVTGEQYTLTIWVKATDSQNLVAAGKNIAVTTEWKKHIVTFVADAADMLFQFQNTGDCYIYHAKLELGNISTDWTPAPEDTGDAIGNLQILEEMFAQLTVNSEGISSVVSKTEEQINTTTGELEKFKEETTEVLQKADQYIISINKKITEDGVTKVSNTTGTFDEEGLTIDNAESPTKTKLTLDGMVVKRKAGGKEEDVLTATSEGVDATNLHAKTYLTVGGRSRFENYSSNRTGCFWIGEN